MAAPNLSRFHCTCHFSDNYDFCNNNYMYSVHVTYMYCMFLYSALRAPMSHRRTFSDTTFFNTLKKSKQGPSSSGNSPSNTPSLFFPSLSPPSSLTPPPFLSKSTSPPTIGVGAIDIVNTSPHRKSNNQEVTIVTIVDSALDFIDNK